MSGIYVGLSSGNVGIGTGGVNAVGAKLNVTGDMSAGFLIGQVSFFTMSTAPTGWLKCNGAAISRTTYAKLFAVTGTTYGVGDGSTTFNLPDLRGEFIRGWADDRAGVPDSGRAFGSFQEELVKQHGHIVAGNNGSGSYGSSDLGAGGSWYFTSVANGIKANLTAYQEGVSSGILGGETRPRNRALLSCIKF